MKRSILRVAAVTGIVGLGAVAVVQAKKGFSSAEPEAAAPVEVARDTTPRPIPLAAQEGDPGVDPLTAAQAGFGDRPRGGDPQARDWRTARASANRYVEAPEEEEPRSAPAHDHAGRNHSAAAYEPGEPRRLHAHAEQPIDPRSRDPYAARMATPATPSGYVEQATEAEPAPIAEPRELPAGPAQEPAADTVNNFAPPATPSGTGGAANLNAGAQRIPLGAEGAGDRGDATQGSGRPGDQQLEGTQTPTLAIEKTAPREIQVGKPATFTIKVRNTGNGTAQGVEIHDEIPKGTQLVDTMPKALQDENGRLVWEVGAIKPNGEKQVQLQLLPISEGEIGSVATVHFKAAASVRTMATKPELNVKLSGPAKVMIGDDVTFKVLLSNPGTGAASGVVVMEAVPQGLKHAAGSELEFEVGTLKPGETRELELTLTAAQAGPTTNVLTVRGEGNLQTEDRLDLEVVAPALKIALTGPKRRYLERSATYNISVSNPGTAPAKDVELMTVLPKGLKFVETNNAGQYDAGTRTVYWSLEELPAGETGTVTLTTLPVEAGDLKLQIRSKAKQGLSDDREETIAVEGLAALLFELVDVHDPIEVNGETTYEVRVMNQGSKAATNIRIVALLPPEMKPLSAEGPVKYVVDGQRVLFDSLTQLAPKADTTYTIKAQCLQPGDLRVRVQMLSDDMRTPVTKEESTRVYADE